MRSTGILLCVGAVALAGAAGRLHADVIVLENGSRLVGTISGLVPGKVLQTTDFAGVLALDATRIVDIQAGKPIRVAFEDGQRAQGTLRVAQVGAVLEGARNLYWRLSAWENLLYFGSIRLVPRGQLGQRAEELPAVE